MTHDLDLLPAAYRQRTQSRAANRQLVWMCVPVLAALFATDLLLRARVRGVERMAQQARENADRGQHLAADTKALLRRITELQSGLDAAARQLAAPRMTELLDGLLAERPDGVRFQELLCAQDPWQETLPPVVHLRANCTTAAEFTQYLTALQREPALPPLACQRSDIRSGSSGFGFLLETDATAIPASARSGGGR